MSADHRHASSHLDRLLRSRNQEQLSAQLAPKLTELPPKVPGGTHISEETLERRWQLLTRALQGRENLLDAQTLAQTEHYEHNVENFIGTVKVPPGLAGPRARPATASWSICGSPLREITSTSASSSRPATPRDKTWSPSPRKVSVPTSRNTVPCGRSISSSRLTCPAIKRPVPNRSCW